MTKRNGHEEGVLTFVACICVVSEENIQCNHPFQRGLFVMAMNNEVKI
jgi:hypothetical protein